MRASEDSKGVRYESAFSIKVSVRRVGRRRLTLNWAVRVVIAVVDFVVVIIVSGGSGWLK